MPDDELPYPQIPTQPKMSWDQMFPPDLSYSELAGDELCVDIRANGETPDKYWADGWLVDFVHATRTKYDWWNGHYHDAYPTRYRLWDFRFSKSLRRVLNKNADLKTVIRPLRITLRKEDLYHRHCVARFGEHPRAPLHKRYEYLVHNASRLTELCVFHPTDGLIAFSIFELGEYSAYGNLSAWSLEHRDRCLGTFTLLKEVQHAISLDFSYYYMGHMYLANPSYRYKTRFSGLEIREHTSGNWLRYESERAVDLLTNERPRTEQE